MSNFQQSTNNTASREMLESSSSDIGNTELIVWGNRFFETFSAEPSTIYQSSLSFTTLNSPPPPYPLSSNENEVSKFKLFKKSCSRYIRQFFDNDHSSLLRFQLYFYSFVGEIICATVYQNPTEVGSLVEGFCLLLQGFLIVCYVLSLIKKDLLLDELSWTFSLFFCLIILFFFASFCGYVARLMAEAQLTREIETQNKLHYLNHSTNKQQKDLILQSNSKKLSVPSVIILLGVEVVFLV
ncbi:hypothetical protein NCAS_0B01790 [Naumovozyma castellii]|uniref:Uncharacterized protein n=1 Tax=Naumovozyma castellii TaxID=27288 RepID=G0VBD7_NAUCA|nr:hypothetical protein NCAS_0B01790 [Naumovozyma castellii CBS 4309]CCC68263.1 hypothetical protein NCAS_0B01790 [Naumovozyma castellii CBS 4309]